MYEQYWNLTANPFTGPLTAETFFSSATHRAALLKMRYLIENGKGAGLLVGSTGTGKTSLIARMAESLPEQCGPFVHVVFPQMAAAELLAYLAVELGAEETQERGLDRTIRRLEQRLAEFGRQQKHPVIVIDEAHQITDSQVFHALQLLLNFQQQPEICFSLIIVGQPSLLARLSRLPQLDDRLAVKAALQPLSPSETAQYVSQRLRASGATSAIFDDSAIDKVFEHSAGIPRHIDRVCDLALLVGYAGELQQITASQVNSVAAELTAKVPA